MDEYSIRGIHTKMSAARLLHQILSVKQSFSPLVVRLFIQLVSWSYSLWTSNLTFSLIFCHLYRLLFCTLACLYLGYNWLHLPVNSIHRMAVRESKNLYSTENVLFSSDLWSPIYSQWMYLLFYLGRFCILLLMLYTKRHISIHVWNYKIVMI